MKIKLSVFSALAIAAFSFTGCETVVETEEPVRTSTTTTTSERVVRAPVTGSTTTTETRAVAY